MITQPPVMREFVDDLARAHLRQPTRTDRLALWLMRCPAVPWRVARSRGGRVTVTRHGTLTGAVVALGRWLWRRG